MVQFQLSTSSATCLDLSTPCLHCCRTHAKTVIPNLEMSKRSKSPVLFPLDEERPLDRRSKEEELGESSTFDVSQSGIPDEDDAGGFLLNLSMHSNSWSPPASAVVDLDVLNVTSSHADTSEMSTSGYLEAQSAVNMSFKSEDGGSVAVGVVEDGQSARTSGSREQELADCENDDHRPYNLEKNVDIPISCKSIRQSTVTHENNGHRPSTPENSEYNGYGLKKPLNLENKECKPTLPDNNGYRYVNPEGSHRREVTPDVNHYRPLGVGDNRSDSPKDINVSFYSVKSESILDEYDSLNLEDRSYELENSDMNDVAVNPQNSSAMDLSASGDATVDANASEVSFADDDVGVTSTTRETVPNDVVPPPPPAEQEVVDVESEQPCVVDLTCEDDDDVDVVAVVEPVIFIGTGQGRESRRRDRGNNPSPFVEDLTDAGSLQEPDARANDDTNNNIAGAEDRGHHEIWHQDIDLQNPNLTFGSLLEQVPIETVDDNSLPQLRPRRHRPQRELRSMRRRRRSGSRSRSPNLFPDMELVDDIGLDLMNDLEGIMNGGNGWLSPGPQPHQLPLDVNRRIEEEHHQRMARIAAPRPPPSPPPIEQPTISCLVCLDSVATIHSSSRTLCSTTCGHVFCSTCIGEVVRQRKQCPVCRKRLTKKQYHPLFI